VNGSPENYNRMHLGALWQNNIGTVTCKWGWVGPSKHNCRILLFIG